MENIFKVFNIFVLLLIFILSLENFISNNEIIKKMIFNLSLQNNKVFEQKFDYIKEYEKNLDLSEKYILSVEKSYYLDFFEYK